MIVFAFSCMTICTNFKEVFHAIVEKRQTEKYDLTMTRPYINLVKWRRKFLCRFYVSGDDFFHSINKYEGV